MRKKITSVIVAVFIMNLFIIPVAAGTAFPDVDDNAEYAWAADLTKEMGLFVGDSNGNFNPYNGITRAEFATVVCRLMGGEAAAKAIKTSVFDDVSTSHWASGCIAWAAENEIVGGYGDGNFGPSDVVTYEQAVKMLVCAIGYSDRAIDAGGWPYGYVAIADNLGILDRVENTFGDSITRANVAVLVGNIQNNNYLGHIPNSSSDEAF